ncbi:LOW QUALITY PROTEIN: PDZ and LIM domain protein 7 [Phalacrocorax carbo]|uniref:LOW QUALITY PROTEIN: PDZ and LIM domain protein 7 n=1 Tax=Phalacrocorax carbo TaxID=9209 RepID=UPI0031197AAD
MGDMESYKVMLNGPAPWGFRLQGGKDFSMPLSISRLTPGGKAAQAGVGVGDWVLYIDGESTSSMTHIEAQNRIRACGDRLCLTLNRAQNHLGKPQKDSLPCSEPLKYNFAPSTALNKTARPFGWLTSEPTARAGDETRDVHTPGACLHPPAQWVLSLDKQPLQPLEPPSTPVCDPVKLQLIEDAEDWQPRTGTSQSRSFRKLAQLMGTDSMEDREDELVKKPRAKLLMEPQSPRCAYPMTGTTSTQSLQSWSGKGVGVCEGTFAIAVLCCSARQGPCRLLAERLPSVTRRQPPQLLEPPSTPVCDPGKLRMIEDAENWQPRTGTSQSRSFRKLAQLMGTDSSKFAQGCLAAMGLEDQEDELAKKPRDRCPDPKQGPCMVLAEYLPSVTRRQPPRLLEPPGTPVCDPGKLQLIEDAEDWQPRTGTSQSCSFRKLAQLMGTDSMEDREDELVKKPRWHLWDCCPVSKQDPCMVPAECLPSVTCRQRLQLLELPSTPVCNPRKLQLIEDAEDWQPHTETSQSRSLCKLAQLMGTDSMDVHDDVFVEKPSQVSVLDPSPGAAMKTEPGLAPRTPAATPGPASRPPWAVDPSFAERYAPDKTSTVVSKHSQPATPTPMQNRSSIVQAAQQAPEGPGRTPLCYKCNKVIRGRYLVALGHYYHPEEFTCCQCRKVLDEGGFFEEKGSIFCPKCYDTRYAPSCAKCKKKIAGEVMHALKMTWHVQCFTCAACKTPIRNRAFYMEEGQPYCERDYEKMFGTKCRGCDFKIDAGDRFLEALGFSWHDTCFVCAICQTNLEGKTFYSKKDKPLCKSHAFSHV